MPTGSETLSGETPPRYGLPSPPCDAGARLVSDGNLPVVIPNQDPLRVGTTLQDVVRIDAQFAVRVVFYRNRRTKDCWVLDMSRYCVLTVNGTVVRNRRLRADDVVAISGLRFVFNGSGIDLERSASDGVTLAVHDLRVDVGGKRNAETIVRDVSFSVPPGEFVGVLGPSGCGKSTLLQSIAGLVGYGGRITLNGTDVAALPGGAVGVCAYLPQNAEEMLHDGLTLREEMTCFLAVHGGEEDDDRQIEPLLDMLGLLEAIDSPVSKLSGGQKRRAAVAMTLLRRPALILLDEPTAGLDPASDAEVMSYLGNIANNKKVTILCSTHVLGNMDRFTRVLALTGTGGEIGGLNGRLVYNGPPDGLVAGVRPHSASGGTSAGVSVPSGGTLREVYRTLQLGAPQIRPRGDDRADTPVRGTDADFHEAPRAIRSFAGYLKRMWAAFRGRRGGCGAESDRSAGPFTGAWPVLRDIFCSSRAFLFFWMPFGVVACIRVGCAADFTTPATGALYFCCIIALYLLGLCHSATRLVDGRVPGRCLERLAGVSTSAYLAAKIVGSLALCTVQTLSFCAIWQISICLPADWFSAASPGAAAPVGPFCAFWTVPVLFAVSFMGSLTGLAVSAVVKNRATAVNCVPVAAVIVLFFSQPNIGYPLHEVAKENRAAAPLFSERISYFTPTVYPQRFLSAAYQFAAARERARTAPRERVYSADRRLQNVKRDFRRVSFRLLSLFLGYLAAAFAVLWLFEPLREREWRGR